MMTHHKRREYVIIVANKALIPFVMLYKTRHKRKGRAL